MAKDKDVDEVEIPECDNHHFACACREAYFIELEAALLDLVGVIDDSEHWIRHTDAYEFARSILGSDLNGKAPS